MYSASTFGTPSNVSTRKTYITIAGTTPNETISASESNCFPSSLLTFSILAIIPSRRSNKPATSIVVNTEVKS